MRHPLIFCAPLHTERRLPLPQRDQAPLAEHGKGLLEYNISDHINIGFEQNWRALSRLCDLFMHRRQDRVRKQFRKHRLDLV